MSCAMVTFSPSRSSLKLIWQDKREYSSRWSELSSRSLSSSPTPGSFATKSGSTCTWQEIGRAHVLTPVTNAHLVCRLLLEQKNRPRVVTHESVIHMILTNS